VFFALASGASLLSIAVEMRLLLHKWGLRRSPGAHFLRGRQCVPLTPELYQHEKVKAYEEKYFASMLERRRTYCNLLLVGFEDIPMGQYSASYRSPCRSACTAHQFGRVCKLPCNSYQACCSRHGSLQEH
jgi:hypothetical protein